MFSRRALREAWTDIRPYVLFAVILFFAGIVVGGTPNEATGWLKEQLRGMSKIAEEARQSDNPQFELFLVILKNNLIKCVMAMYLGVAAGIVPLIMLTANGMILGFLFGGMADHGENVWMLVVKGILPHGILELPAFFLACAFGLRMGLAAVRGIFASLLGKHEPWRGLSLTAARSVPALVVVASMLAVAAVIESTITYWLVS